jgi:hypothetical protein
MIMKSEDLPRIREVIKSWAINYPIQANQLGESAMALSRAFGTEIGLIAAEDRIGNAWADSLTALIEAEFLEEL